MAWIHLTPEDATGPTKAEYNKARWEDGAADRRNETPSC